MEHTLMRIEWLKYALGLIPSSELPEVGVKLLLAGETSDEVAYLAGLSKRDSSRKIEDAGVAMAETHGLPLFTSEKGWDPIKGEALRLVAQDLVDPIEGATFLSVLSRKPRRGGQEQFLDLLGFAELLEMLDENPELHQQVLARVKRKARQMLIEHPDYA